MRVPWFSPVAPNFFASAPVRARNMKRSLPSAASCRMGAPRPELRRSFGFVRTALLVLGITQAASAEVRLGGLFQHTPSKVGRFMAFVMAIQEINNSTDLLPGNALR